MVTVRAAAILTSLGHFGSKVRITDDETRATPSVKRGNSRALTTMLIARR
jgi:hypothetical protein